MQDFPTYFEGNPWFLLKILAEILSIDKRSQGRDGQKLGYSAPPGGAAVSLKYFTESWGPNIPDFNRMVISLHNLEIFRAMNHSHHIFGFTSIHHYFPVIHHF